MQISFQLAVFILNTSSHCMRFISIVILGDPGAVSRVDKMFAVKVFCKIDSILQKTFTANILSTRLTASGSPRMINSAPSQIVNLFQQTASIHAYNIALIGMPRRLAFWLTACQEIVRNVEVQNVDSNEL